MSPVTQLVVVASGVDPRLSGSIGDALPSVICRDRSIQVQNSLGVFWASSSSSYMRPLLVNYIEVHL